MNSLQNRIRNKMSKELGYRTDVWTHKDKHRIYLKDKQLFVSTQDFLNEIKKSQEYYLKTRNEFKKHDLKS